MKFDACARKTPTGLNALLNKTIAEFIGNYPKAYPHFLGKTRLSLAAFFRSLRRREGR